MSSLATSSVNTDSVDRRHRTRTQSAIQRAFVAVAIGQSGLKCSNEFGRPVAPRFLELFAYFRTLLHSHLLEVHGKRDDGLPSPPLAATTAYLAARQRAMQASVNLKTGEVTLHSEQQLIREIDRQLSGTQYGAFGRYIMRSRKNNSATSPKHGDVSALRPC